MATKLQFYSAVAEQTAKDLTGKRGSWIRYLDTAARLYKYSFPDQMMIFAQRPDAVACAEIELWNEQFNRWVRRGSKGIALIDDNGNRPRLKYVFDVSDTEAVRYNARPVRLWEMRPEHKEPVLAELAKSYEDISDSLADSFRNIAKQLSTEYYEDNSRDIHYRAEGSSLEPDTSYDFSGTPIEQRDDSSLASAFIDAISTSVAYTIMSRCGLNPADYFEDDDFQSIFGFNTPDMVYALGTATSDLSEQVLRDVELVIKKYERSRTAERGEQSYDRNPHLHADRRLSAAEPEAVGGTDGGSDAAREVREDTESVPEGTQTHKLQPPADDRETLPASEGDRGDGDIEAGTGDEYTDGGERLTGQGDRADRVDEGDEYAESSGGGNGLERADLQLDNPEQGAAEEAAPLSMAEAAQLHADLNERLIFTVTNDESVLNAAVNSDKGNTLIEIAAAIKTLKTSLLMEIIESTQENKSAILVEFDSYFSADRNPPLNQQLYDAVISSDAYLERTSDQGEDELPDGELPETDDSSSDNEPDSRLDIPSIEDIMSTSPIGLGKVDAILRDGANSYTSALRIAARFAKGKTREELTAYLRREYLCGRYDHAEHSSGKGFDFGNYHVCAWFDTTGIQLAVGVTARNNIHRVIIPWETAAERIEQLMLGGQYVSRDVFDEALDNEKLELAERLWHFYRDNIHEIPEEWRAHKGGYPEDRDLIKSLLDDYDEREAILERLEADVSDTEHDNRAPRLLADLRDAMLPPVIFPDAEYRNTSEFSYFITQDEVDAFLIQGGNSSGGKLRIMSHFLCDRTDNGRVDFLKREYGHGGGTLSDINGWSDATPGKGITLQRGNIMNPDAEINLKWNAVAKRTGQLIAEGRYMTRAELDAIPNYERLILTRQLNSFFYDLPDEYERPFKGRYGYLYNDYRDENGNKMLDFMYPGEAEWNAISDLLDNPERVHALLARMEPIYTNMMEEDRYFNTRKTAWDNLNAYREGTYTLFPGIDRLPEPGTVSPRRFNEPRRETIVDISGGSFAEIPQEVEQLTLDALFGELPDVGEQLEKIDRILLKEAEAVVTAIDLSITQEDIAALFTIIDDTDKKRIVEQFTTAPRSREAVALVREIYGSIAKTCPRPDGIAGYIAIAADTSHIILGKGLPSDSPDRIPDETITLSWAGVTKQIAELVAEGAFAVPEQDEPVLNEVEHRAPQSEGTKPPMKEIVYNIGDKFTYNNKPHEIEAIGDYVNARNLGTPSAYPVFDYISFLKHDFESMLSEGNIIIEPLEADIAEPAEAELPIDFDTVAQVILARVMADTDYIGDLADAKTRASLRNPCAWALEQSIRNHETDEPQIYRAYFSDDDFNDRLYDYVLKQSWAKRPILETPAVSQGEQSKAAAPYKQGDTFYQGDGNPYILNWVGFHEISYNSPDKPYISTLMEKTDFEELLRSNPLNSHLSVPDGVFTEITDPAELAEIEAVFGDIKPPPNYIVGQRVVLDLNEKLRGIFEPNSPGNAGEFVIDSINGDNVMVSITYNTDGTGSFGEHGSQDGSFTTSLTIAEVERYTVQPIAQKIYDERSPSGKETTAYYLIRYPDGIDAGAGLSHETLALIKDKADGYVICAEACFLSSEEMAAWNIEFCKMPRDWGMLPEQMQAELRAIRPEYETQWQETYDTAAQTSELRVIPAQNFRITDDHLGEGGAKMKFSNNMAALTVLKKLEADNRNASHVEQEILSRYIGWGGLPQAFDADNKQWASEYRELVALLTPDEYTSARASTLNAHYTSPTIISAMYEAVEMLGFRAGNVLEPSCGVGNFFGMLPDIMKGSKLYGVELDNVTARIAQKLYPSADIRMMGYEDTDFPDAFFDLAIGNVPFGDYSVLDKRYDKHKFAIHDYFFAKTLDQVRPGGVIAFITSKYTLDKQNPTVRKYIAQKADLLGAVRLPNDAFLKNAGTETTMDILFLQKRDRPLDIEPDWVHLGLTDDGIPVNRYYLDNPEMILGKMALDKRMNDKYGRDDVTACLPTEGADLAEQLKRALSFISGEYTVAEVDDLDGVDNNAVPADPDVKNFSYTLVENKVYFRENSMMYPVDLPATTLERISGMIELRDCVQALIALQLDDFSDDEIKAKQVELGVLYDKFNAEFGLISSSANNRAFSADSSYYLLSSLEILDEDGELERKADMFTKRTIKQKTVITHVDTASEALAVSLGEKACVDLPYMSELTGFSEEKLVEDLKGVIYLNVGKAENQAQLYVTADEYLSGNVREKLALARAAEAGLPGTFTLNVSALEAAQPKDLDASEISVRLGSTWIDPEYVQEFMYELLNTSEYGKKAHQVRYHTFSGEWGVTGKGRSQFSDIHSTVTYGTERMNAYQIIDDTLNLRDVRVYDYKVDADGHESRVLNKKETTLAQQKQELIKREFSDWIWKDAERRQTLVTKYNEMFNSMRPREYDGSHITFPGISPEISLMPHQLSAIAHMLYGGNTLLAHEVGAGKTFEMVGAAMESKRLGLCQKSLFSVPNHLTEQMASEFLRLYPSANILVARKKDFEMRNRKKFCAKIATGDYDAVIIGHSQLEKIPISRERQEKLLQEQLWEIMEGINDLKRNDGERFSIKQLEKSKKSIEMRLKKLIDAKKRDDVVTFEQLGVDRLFVDEAHNFKNLFLYTKMRNVAGLSTSDAQKSSDLFMKCRYMDELTDGKGIVFATGTPISNSMTEMYTMQRYLQYDTLVRNGLTHFDAWASIFGETVTSIELAPEGTGYRARTRFAKFHNLPELMCMFKEVADIKTADMLNLPVPNAKYEVVVVEPSELQKQMVQELSKRAAAVHARLVEPYVDNMLKITTDGRKIGLDQRLINPMLPDFDGSKVNACSENIFKIWEDTRAERLTQLAFCDFSTPNKDGRFNIYDDIRAKLLERGVPESEIAFIHDADTDIKKKELFAKVRQGKVRILFGSTFKMGAGTNVQDRLVATHDVDCPWRPSDLEQRAGRIVRQGNMNDDVQIFRYATNGTFDSYLWQTIESKQKFISQIMSSKSPARSCEDCDETVLSYAEIKALCAGNPLIAEKMNLDIEVAKLRMLKSEHQSLIYRLEDSLLKYYPQQITAVTERIKGIENDIALYAEQKAKTLDVQPNLTGDVSAGAKFPGMTIDGVEYPEKEAAAKALLESCKGVDSTDSKEIGEYMGFKLSVALDGFQKQFHLFIRGQMTYKTELGTDTFGNMTRINNVFDALPKFLKEANEKLENLQSQQVAAKVEVEKPFPQEGELKEKETRLVLINSDLNIDGEGGMDVENDPDNRDSQSRMDDDPEELDDEEEFTFSRASASAKAKSSILDGIRNFPAGKPNTALDRDKPLERAM